MSTFVRFTPISGCRQQDNSPLSYLLEIDQARLLLDCGLNPSSLTTDHFNILKKTNIDAILISHATIEHVGGLPWVVGGLGIGCPVLGTVPVHHFGLVTCYDAYQSFLESNGKAPESLCLDHVDRSFEHMTMLRCPLDFILS